LIPEDIFKECPSNMEILLKRQMQPTTGSGLKAAADIKPGSLSRFLLGALEQKKLHGSGVVGSSCGSIYVGVIIDAQLMDMIT
jgi:hypothetical protein